MLVKEESRLLESFHPPRGPSVFGVNDLLIVCIHAGSFKMFKNTYNIATADYTPWMTISFKSC